MWSAASTNRCSRVMPSRGTTGPCTSTPETVSANSRWMPRCPEGSMPMPSSTGKISPLVRPPSRSRGVSSRTTASIMASSMPSCRCREAACCCCRAAVISSTQPRSRAGIVCSVPRMVQARTMSPRSNAASTSRRRASPFVRTASAHRPAVKSWLCTASSRAAAPATSASGAVSPCHRSRSSRHCEVFMPLIMPRPTPFRAPRPVACARRGPGRAEGGGSGVRG